MSHNEHAFSKKNVLLLVQTILIFLLLAVVIGLFFAMRAAEQSADIVPAANPDGASAETKEPVTEPVVIDHYYELSGHKILLQDSTYGEIYLPVLADVPAFSRQLTQIVRRNGRNYYVEDGTITSQLGIDVSAHQHEIDWNQVKAAGIEFAIIRLGYRTYGGGEINLDDCFYENILAAKTAGIAVGVYFFSQAITEEEAIEEAQFVLRTLEGWTLEYPVVYDWELIYDDTARTDDVPVDILTDCCLAFTENITAGGYEAMLYQNKRTSLMKLDLTRLTGIPFWLAEYNDQPTYYYDFQMWQYSCTGSVPGIVGDVDMNISFVNYAAQ